MPDFCEVAIENLVHAMNGRAELLAMHEHYLHECEAHNNVHACDVASDLTKQLGKNHQRILNLVEDMQQCMRRLPVPIGQVRR